MIMFLNAVIKQIEGTSDRRLKSTMTASRYFTLTLDAQGAIQESVVYDDKEEGEIIHSLSKEQIAELFKLNVDEVVMNDTDKHPSPEQFDDVDEVEVEDVTDEYYPQYTSVDNEDLPNFSDFFNQQSEEVLERKIEEKAGSSEPTEDEKQELDRLKKEWAIEYKANLQRHKAQVPEQYTKLYRVKGHRSSGMILSWGYFLDLNCYGVKRERGIEYYRFPHDFKSLPMFDLNRLNYLNMLYSNTWGMASYFEDLLRMEYRRKWVNLKPQVPKRIISKTEIDPVSKKPKVTLKYKPPLTMKKIPLRKMVQNFSSKFKWWYYDGRTHEAVIVLDKDKEWDTIRVFDPMWLTNLSSDDVYTLYKCQILFDLVDMEQALRYRNVIRICFAYDIHSGSDWKEQQKKFAEENRFDLNV